MRESDLAELLKERGLPMAVVVNIETGNVLRVGSGGKTEFDDLLNSLFGDAAAIRATNDSLHSQILPRIWGQDRSTCVLFQPREGTIVGIFCNKEMSPAELFHLSKDLIADVDRMFT